MQANGGPQQGDGNVGCDWRRELGFDAETAELLGLDDVDEMLDELGDGTAEREVEFERPESTE